MKYKIDIQRSILNRQLYVVWIKNAKYHRLNGPAWEWANGKKAWYKDGKWHCEDGPAVEFEDGSKFWYINEKQYPEKEFNKVIQSCKK